MSWKTVVVVGVVRGAQIVWIIGQRKNCQNVLKVWTWVWGESGITEDFGLRVWKKILPFWKMGECECYILGSLVNIRMEMLNRTLSIEDLSWARVLGRWVHLGSRSSWRKNITSCPWSPQKLKWGEQRRRNDQGHRRRSERQPHSGSRWRTRVKENMSCVEDSLWAE